MSLEMSVQIFSRAGFPHLHFPLLPPSPCPPRPYSDSSSSLLPPLVCHRLEDPSSMQSRRRLPSLPEVGPFVPKVPRSQSPSRSTQGFSSLPLSRSQFFAAASTSSLDLSLSIPHLPSPPATITSSRPALSRSQSLNSKYRSASPFARAAAWFGAPKSVAQAEAVFEDEEKKRQMAETEAAAIATRIRAEYSLKTDEVINSSIQHTTWKNATGAMYEDEQRQRRATESEAAVITARMKKEEDFRNANETVKSSIQSLLSRGLRDEDCDAIIRECAQICTSGGLNLSDVLQEPLINGKPPVYWAILGGPTTTEAALHALVLSLLDNCQPIKETTVVSIRLACMLTSSNALLQHLFWHFPALSPLSQIDTLLLSSTTGGDAVDVHEAQDSTGSFAARIQIRRFRLRMRVSKLIKLEFVTSDRIWTVTFSLGAYNTSTGRPENQWWLSIGLGDQSFPARVEGDLVVLRRLPTVGGDDKYEAAFSLPFGSNPCNLQPGPNSAINLRIDHGPLRPHLLNGSATLVDCDGTLHAQFNVRLAQIPLPPLAPRLAPRASIKSRDGASLMSTKTIRPLSLFSKTDKRPNGERKVYTSLRRGGR